MVIHFQEGDLSADYFYIATGTTLAVQHHSAVLRGADVLNMTYDDDASEYTPMYVYVYIYIHTYLVIIIILNCFEYH